MTNPIIILVGPQMVENIGMTARAMMNCALPELRIVNPRDPWPLDDWLKERLYAASSGADEILNNAKLYATVPEAIPDLNHVYATTARGQREMVKRWLTPRAAMPEMQQRMASGQKIGILFGPERTGLINDDVTLSNDIISIPMNPEFSSLNLAQAVLLLGYEWYQFNDRTPASVLSIGNSQPATKDELMNFISRLEQELETAGFFTTEELRPTMQRNLRNTLQRAEMTEQEVRTWHGVIKALTVGPKRGKKAS